MNAVPLFRIIVIKSTLWFHFMGTLNTKAKSCAFSLVSGFTRGSNSQCYITFFISSFELNDRVSNLCGKMSSCEIIPVAINHHLECVLKRRDFFHSSGANKSAHWFFHMRAARIRQQPVWFRGNQHDSVEDAGDVCVSGSPNFKPTTWFLCLRLH